VHRYFTTWVFITYAGFFNTFIQNHFMTNIKIISSSVRTGRKSHRVVLFFKKFLEQKDVNVEIIDLKELNLPVLHERLRYLTDPPGALVSFSEKIKSADGILIVTPEYNGGYPPALKNATDALYDEWKRKPVAIATVSSGAFGGTQVITSLLFTLWKIGAWMVPAMFPVPDIEKAFNEDGEPSDAESINRRAEKFAGELLWCVEASKKMNQAG
jgi:NAD(P)H-dependent FMN reductase